MTVEQICLRIMLPLFGVAGLLIGGYQAWFLIRSHQAEGTLIQHKEYRVNPSKGLPYVRNEGRIRFKTSGNRVVVISARISNGKGKYRVGQRISVRYDPDDPETATPPDLLEHLGACGTLAPAGTYFCPGWMGTPPDSSFPGEAGNHVENVIRVDSISLAVLDGFTITGGQASSHGGGLLAIGAFLIVARTHFYLNQAGGRGGGMYLSGSNAAVMLCMFSQNTALEVGGVYLEDGHTEFENSYFIENTAYLGGGMRADTASIVLMTNSVLGNNHSTADGSGGGGGGFAANTADATFINCTFAENTSAFPNTGAGISNFDTNLTIVNSILWGPGSQLLCSPASACDITYSNVSGGFVGTGNLDSAPMFEDPSIGDFRLRQGSPCIDSANGDLAPQRDAVFIPRVDDPLVPNTGTGTPNYADRGAYEHLP